MRALDRLESDTQPAESTEVAARRSRWLELGLGIVVIAVPLVFLPASYAPFVDVKLALLLAGAVMVWAGHRARSTLRVPAAAWVGTLAVAGILGVDWWWSLTGPERVGNGLLLLGGSAFLLVVGTGVPDSIRERIPIWLAATSTVVALVGLVYRTWPEALDYVVPGLSFEGGTLGHPVYLAGFVAIGLIAAVGLNRLSARSLVPLLVILSTALALSTKRVGWVALAVGLAVALWRARPPRRRAFLIVGVVAATLVTWTAVDAFFVPSVPFSGARRFGELTTDSARARVTTWVALTRGWASRPVLGWGPGNAWSAYMASAATPEIEVAGRGMRDAHNFLVEAPVTTGGVGLGALLILGVLTVRQMRKGPRSLGWAAGGAAALGVYHLMQPYNVSLTPLFFLLAGLACPSPPGVTPADTPGEGRRRRLGPPRRLATGALLAAAAVVAAGVLVASVLEQYGRTYASEAALRNALHLTPRRVTVAEALALHLALDGRAGDPLAERDAKELAARMVETHPWNPEIRLVAADVHLLLRDHAGAVAWVERHLSFFPEDPIPPPPPENSLPPPPS